MKKNRKIPFQSLVVLHQSSLAAVFAPTVKSGLPSGEFMGFPVIEAVVTPEMAEFARKFTMEHQYPLRQTLWPNDAGSNVEKMEIAVRNWLSKRCHQSDRGLMQAANVYRPGSGGTKHTSVRRGRWPGKA